MLPNAASQTRWACDICRRQYDRKADALRCETQHASVARRLALYKDAVARRLPLVGSFAKEDDGIWRLYRIQMIEGVDGRSDSRDPLRQSVAETLFQFYSASGIRATEYLPDEPGPDHLIWRRYLSPKEAVGLGWCPFFLQHYQQHAPLSLREDVADAFLSLSREKQREILLARRAFAGYDED